MGSTDADADANKIDKETSGFDQLSVLFGKEVHCAGCDGNCSCLCGKEQ